MHRCVVAALTSSRVRFRSFLPSTWKKTENTIVQVFFQWCIFFPRFDVFCALPEYTSRTAKWSLLILYIVFMLVILLKIRNVFEKLRSDVLRDEAARRTLRLITSFIRLYFNHNFP